MNAINQKHYFAKLALIIAFIILATDYFWRPFYSDLPGIWRFLYLIVLIPSVIMGSITWSKTNTIGRSPIMITSLMMMFFGIFWVDLTERSRGLLLFTQIAVMFPISSLIIYTKSGRILAQVYIVASIIALGLMISSSTSILTTSNFRLAFMVNDEVLTNPNNIGASLIFAIILTIILGQLGLKPNNESDELVHMQAHIWVVVLIFLGIGVALTASRTSVVTLTIVSAWIITKLSSRLITPLIILLLLVGSLILLSGYSPLNNIFSRLSYDNPTVTTFGGRLIIWENVGTVLNSDPRIFLFGTGTGGVEKQLGIYIQEGARIGPDNIRRKSSHNTFIEYGLSYGFIGCVIGLGLLVKIILRSRELDDLQGVHSRTIILVTTLIISMGIPIQRQTFWIAIGSLFLAMLSDQNFFENNT